MTKRNLWYASMTVFVLLPAAGFLRAAPSEHLNWGSQINQAQCPIGPLVVNVVQKVVNDADSGVGGNTWALDDFVRQIQVVQTGTGTFCATVSYQGSFTTFAGLSPNNTGTVDAGVVGTFQGGYISNFSATLSSNPTARTRGSIGTVDYNCDASGAPCSGYVDWTTLYFNNGAGASPLSLGWWGWVYHAGNNGSWVNASAGNSGDITGN